MSLKCNVCYKSVEQVNHLFQVGNDINICDQCITELNKTLNLVSNKSNKKNETINQNNNDKKINETWNKNQILLTPKQIYKQLEQWVVKQEKAKQSLSVASWRHLRKISRPIMDDVTIKGTNVMLVGPTGSGKTFLVETLSKVIDVPLVIIDATTITEAGYVGDDVESILSRLYLNSNQDLDKAQHGIVFIDEIDKKAAKSSSNGSRDVSGEGVQQSLLKMIEGGEFLINPNGAKKTGNSEVIKFKTNNLLFIFGGAFSGLNNIRDKRLNDNSIGFINNNKKDNESKNFIIEDFEKYGMIKEFIGRIPIIVELESLSKETLKEILIRPKNSIIKQYRSIFRDIDIDINFTDDFYDEIANKALKSNYGARSLNKLVAQCLEPFLYNQDQYYNQKLIINKTHIKED